MKIVNLAVALLSALVAGQASAADTGMFAGVGSARKTTFGYIGGTRAMNGDLSKNGVLLRGMLYSGRYDYDTVAVAAGKVEGKVVGAELGVGYQWFNPGSRFSIYGGIDHQNHDLSPNDTGNSVNGAKTGAAVQAEIETLDSPWYGGLIAKYSSAYDSYWVRGRVGYPFGSVNIGPEAILVGNESFKESRFGLFLDVPVSKSTALSLSAGHRKSKGDNAREDQTGGYVDASVSVRF
jgi:hypothetical protein